MEIVEISESVLDSGVFYFEAIIDGSKKSGQIKSNDIFRAYKKLVDDLHYQVISIYDNKDADEKEKLLITAKVKESYDYFKSTEKEQITDATPQTQDVPLFIQKELEKYYSLIDRVIEKIEYILSQYIANISLEKKEKLTKLIPLLRQVKNITNLDKLKIV